MNVLSFARLLLFVFALAIGVPALADAHGVLRVVKGDVQIKTADGTTSKARLGQEVHPKDTIITGKDSRAKIVMIDNNEINVSPDSNVEIQNYEYKPEENKKDVLLNVIYGKVRSKVEQKYDGKTSKFQVKTPSAVAGVRGTDFITGYAPATQSTQVVTFRGAVEFGTPGPNGTITNSVSVTPGRTASNTAGGPPSSPVAVPKDQLAKMDHESKADQGSGSDSRTPAQDGRKGGSNSPNNSPSGSGSSGGSSGSSSNSSGASNGPTGGSSGGTSPGPTAATGGGPSTPSASNDAPASGGGSSAPTTSGGAPANDPSSSSGGDRSPASTPVTAAAPSVTAPATMTPTLAPPTTMLNPAQDLPTGAAAPSLATIPMAPAAVQAGTVPVTTTIPAAAAPPTATCTACQINANSGPVPLTIHIK